MIEQAEGYAIDRVNRAQGDAVLFEDVYAAYRRAPEVTRRRIYLETMADDLPSRAAQDPARQQISKGVLPLLQLDGAEVKQ